MQPRHLVSLGLGLALGAAPARAQSRPVAYPQDSVVPGNGGNCGPLGWDASSPQCDQNTTQILIPERHLPSTGGLLTGIEVLTSTAKSMSYSQLEIDVGNATGPTLGSVFAANMATRVRVLTLTNTTLNYQGGAWTTIPFATPFAYAGAGGLVFEFRKVISSTQAVGAFMRHTLGQAGFAYPPLRIAVGAGAATAPQANGWNRTIRMRLLFDNTPTMTVLSNQGGTYGRVFALGQPITMTAHTVPGALVGHLVDFNGNGLLTTPLTIPIVGGQGWVRLGSPVVWTLGTTTAGSNGQATLSFNLPNFPSLVGQQLGFQSVVASPIAGLVWTCATNAFINY